MTWSAAWGAEMSGPHQIIITRMGRLNQLWRIIRDGATSMMADMSVLDNRHQHESLAEKQTICFWLRATRIGEKHR